MTAIQKKTISLKSFFALTYIITWLFPLITLSSSFLDEQKIRQDLQCIQQDKHIDHVHQKAIIDNLQSALYFISERKYSNIKIKEYQKIIDDFSYTALQLREEYNSISSKIIDTHQNISIHELKQKIFQTNNQLIDLTEQLRQEQNQARSINESLMLLPQQQATIRNILNNLEQQQILHKSTKNPLEQTKFTRFQAEKAARRIKIAELEFAQLSASNRTELSRLRIALLKKKYDCINNELQILRNRLNYLCQKETNETIEHTEKILSNQNNTLPQSIKKQLQTNRDLSIDLNQQAYYLNNIASKKQEVISHTLQVKQAFSDLLEQAQWLDKSPVLGETLRSQVSNLPKMPKTQQLDHDMAQLRAKRLQYENQLNKLTLLLSQSKQDDGTPFTSTQKKTFETQLATQRNLIISLLNSYDTHILELTKLKVAYEQLKEALQNIQKATHRYLFWVADIHPITISYPLDIYQDIRILLTEDKINYQLIAALQMIYSDKKTLMLITLCAITSIVLYFSIRNHYQEFLERSNKKIGKVNKDNFLLTFNNIWYSALMALPIPTLWSIIGYSLSHAWMYPIAVAIGDGINTTAIILWACITNAYFASPKGLFIAHFGWSRKKVQQVFSRHYIWSVIIMIFLIITCTVFNNYNDRIFSNTLGRLSFILLCIHLTFITNTLKYSNIPLYLNKYDSSNNIINNSLWNIMICAPMIAIISSILGYLFVAQALLARLETSLLIWIILLIFYHIICRWMSIQRRRIAFERAKKRRATLLVLRTHNKLHALQTQTNKLVSNSEKNEKNLDLNTISIQSLQLIRPILTLMALLLMALLWSELHSAFSFLENVTLWDVTSTIKGVENIQPITLYSFLIAVMVIIITTKTVQNLPAFLELTFLQRLNLTPGTSYAITTLTKYMLMLLGSMIGCSLIGIEWAKIQWLIAALGVGLGFGLQEIFANFISGLIILFEKPIRIGDTITICKLTGKVSQINTRATIITDWNNKEIIVPNKEFITKKFINWSLSDTITRVVLRVPAPLQIDVNKMTKVLLQIAKDSSFALHTPPPEVYLADLQQGLPVFEIRIHISNTKLRMPLCHQIHILIIEYYQNNKLKLPQIPVCLYNNQLSISNFYQNYSQSSYHTTK